MRNTVLTTCALLISACTSPPFVCEAEKEDRYAISAGCIAIRENKLLVIVEQSGKLSIPGGSSKKNETAACTAKRETWEETGLEVTPQALIKIWPNGFHLYHCTANEASAELSPPQRLEIREAFWLAPEGFAQHEWRFPQQMHWLQNFLDDVEGDE